MADKIAEVPKDLAAKLTRPDMVHVKLRKAQPGRQQGEVLYLDVRSAGALVGRGDAEFHDVGSDPGGRAPISIARGRANVSTSVVRAGDLPANPTSVDVVGTAAEGKTAK
jgi:hypothetical protein